MERKRVHTCQTRLCDYCIILIDEYFSASREIEENEGLKGRRAKRFVLSWHNY